MAASEAQGKVVAVLAGFVGTSLGILIGWFGTLADIARLQEQVTALSNSVQDMRMDIKDGTADRYRGADAARDQRYLTGQIQSNAESIDHLQELMQEHLKKHP